METLKKRSEFLRIRGGARWATAAFVLEAKPRPEFAEPGSTAAPRFGFTVTKKLGSAVVRNRIRRRLKSAVEKLAPRHARPGCDYVLVARAGALTRPFPDLLSDLEQAFERVNRVIDSRARAGDTESARTT